MGYKKKADCTPEEWAEIAAAQKVKNLEYRARNRESMQEKAKARRTAAVTSGLCPDCWGAPACGVSQMCEGCWVKKVADRAGVKGRGAELIEKLNAQGRLCVLTGRPLVAGANASVDHTLPKSRFPELASDMDNLRWADCSANNAKGPMTLDEFAVLCWDVIRHNEQKAWLN